MPHPFVLLSAWKSNPDQLAYQKDISADLNSVILCHGIAVTGIKINNLMKSHFYSVNVGIGFLFLQSKIATNLLSYKGNLRALYACSHEWRGYFTK